MVSFPRFYFWARGYCVSTVGLDEQTVRAYIQVQEVEEKRQETTAAGPLGSFTRCRPLWRGLHQTVRSAGGS